MEKAYSITRYNKWRIEEDFYIIATSHKLALNQLPLKATRISNKRFRDIEITGHFYIIEDPQKFGKSFVYEINNINHLN